MFVYANQLVLRRYILVGSFILRSKLASPPSLFFTSSGILTSGVRKSLAFEILASAADKTSPAGFLANYKIIFLTYLLSSS